MASLGATGVGAIDPLRPIAEICRAENLYLHVDAAWAGSALLLEEQRWMIEGIKQADSFVLNPHKWLLTNFDCSAHFVRDPGQLVRTLSVLPHFLTSREGSAVIDYRDWASAGPAFSALKLWFVIRAYGIERLQAMLREHIALARELASQIEAEPDFELTTPASLALLTFRYRPAGLDEAALDALERDLLHTLNGAAASVSARTRGRY